MKKELFNSMDASTIDLLNQTSQEIEQNDIKYQKNQIIAESDYSSEINSSFSGYEEFKYIASLNLQEAVVTRRTLVRAIDLDLYITSKQKTNYELMMEGSSPYASDSENDVIILHHIGQAFDGPFAELTSLEYSSFGNSKLLHSIKNESWRQDKQKLNAFQSEKIKYWQMRAKNEIKIVSIETERKSNSMLTNYIQKDVVDKIKEPIDKIFSACSVNDLIYISNLAQNYILTKKMGASTVEEFVLSLQDDTKTITCPYCNKENFTFYGYQEANSERKQRYKCKECGHIFSLFNNSIISGCNMSFMTWLKFIDCMYNAYSIKKTAKLCGISEKSAFNNRMKLFYALELLDKKVLLSDEIVIDETYVHVSYKGNHDEELFFTLDRNPRKRGGEVHTPGTSKEQVCIVCALDSCGNSIAHVAGLGGPNPKKLEIVLNNYIDKKDSVTLYSDMSSAIKSFAKNNYYQIHQSVLFNSSTDKASKTVKRHIQRMNSYHSRFKKFIGSFYGVSTDLLSGYANLFSWKERNKNREPIEAYKELLSVMTTPNYYKSIDEITAEKIIVSAFDVEEMAKKPSVSAAELKRFQEMYELWQDGMSMEQIGRRYNISKQRVSQIIEKHRKLGYAYSSKREEAQKQKINKMKLREDRRQEQLQSSFDRNYAMYVKKQEWTGSDDDFYKKMNMEYGLSKQTIKNRISDVKRVIALKKTFYAYEKYEHKTLCELFEIVFERYKEIYNTKNITKKETYEIVGKEFGYKSNMVRTIVSNMQNPSQEWKNKKKTKIPKSQVLHRDIAVFIDFMNWSGTRSDFFEYAQNSYGIKKRTVQDILQMNYVADPTRFELQRFA